MSILRVPYLECDGCGIGVMGEKGMNANRLRQSMWEDGWRCRLIDFKWHDLCPDCVRKHDGGDE